MSLGMSLQEEKICGKKRWQSQFIVNALYVPSRSPMFSLPRQSTQALNQLSRTCELNTRKIINHAEISNRAEPAPLDDPSHRHQR